MRHQRKTSTRRGVALIVALLAILVLSVLGTSLLFTTNTDEMVARNYQSEVEALFAAHAGLAVGLKHAYEDYVADQEGGWENSILALGATVPAGWRGPNVKLDADGSVTGTKNCYYYDLKDWQCTDPAPAAPCSPPIDLATWNLLADQPYNLPPATELKWSDTGPGKVAQYLPNLGSFRLKFQAIPELTSDPVTGYEREVMRIQSVGQSGGAIGGVEGGVAGVKSTRMVLGTYKIKDVGIWKNAFYGTNSDEPLKGNCIIRGSIHYLNSNCPTCAPLRTPAVEFGGNAGQRNNYTNIEIELGKRLPIPANNDLDSEFRLRVGSVGITSNQAWVGIPCSDSSKPCEAVPAGIGLTVGKGPNEAAYIGISDYPLPQFTGSKSGNHREDELDEYDLKDFDLGIPPYDDQPYKDTHGHDFPNGYVEYLRGLSNGTGVHALNLKSLARGLHFETGKSSTLYTEVSKHFPSSVAGADNQLYYDNVRSAGGVDVFPGLSAYDFEVGVPWNAAWGPAPTPNPWKASDGITSMDFLYDPSGRSRIVGVFKHLPAKTANPSSLCEYESAAGGAGFLFIPSDGGGALTNSDLTPAMLWDFIQRNFVRYDSSLNDTINSVSFYDIRRFLGIATTAADPRNTAPGIVPDFNGNNAVDGIEKKPTGGDFGRLLIWNTMHTDDDIIWGSDSPSTTCNLAYMGRGTFAQEGAGVQSQMNVSQWLVTIRLFPCVDGLGHMTPTSLVASDVGSQASVMFINYAKERLQINRPMEIAGAFMADTLTFGTGAQLYVDQVPESADCLPWFMIGNWHYYKAEQLNWSER